MERGTLIKFNWVNAFEQPHPDYDFPFSAREVNRILKNNVGYKCHNCKGKGKEVFGWQFIVINGFWYCYYAGWHKLKEFMGKEMVIFT